MKVSTKRFNSLFSNAGKCRIAVIGDLMLDVYISGSASRLSQEAPVPILRVKSQTARLGGAANVMRNLTSLAPECQVFAYGVTGHDEKGVELKRLLDEDGINTDGILSIDGRRTTEKIRVIAANQQLVRMDFEDTWQVDDKSLEIMKKEIISKMKHGLLDAIIFEDYAKGLLEKDSMQEIVDAAVKYGVFTSMDPHIGHPLEVKHLSLMTPNRAEAFGLAGLYCADPADKVEQDTNLAAAAARLISLWEPERLLVTLSQHGMALFNASDKNNIFVIPTVAREVFDVSGAGDTVIGTYTLMTAAGASPEEAAFISNQAAGVVVGKSGTAVTNRAEIADSMKSCVK